MEFKEAIKSLKLKREAENFVRRITDDFALGETEWYSAENALTLAKELAESAVQKTQVRGIVEISRSTGSIADIIDALKVRVGRDYRGNGWDKAGVGRRLIDTLRSLRAKVDEFMKEHTEFDNEDPDIGRLIHLQLCRNFLDVMSAHFEYAMRVEEDKDE